MYRRIITFFVEKQYLSFEMVRYVVSGGTAALSELAILYGLTEFAGLWYIYSAAIAFTVAVGISFSLQKFWTFGDTVMDKVHLQALSFFGVSVLNLGINLAGLFVLVEVFGFWYLFAQVLVAGTIAIASFLIYKFIIFKNDVIPETIED